MNTDELKERLIPLIREHLFVIVLGLAGVCLMGYGLIYLLVTKGDSSEISFEPAEKRAEVNERKGTQPLTVDIEGAVVRPGVYKLPAESRVQDALIAAGGMSGQADRMKVAKGMNLAAKVIDGGKIYIPYDGETTIVSTFTSGQEQTGDQVLGSTSGNVNINTASESELDSLSGVGPATAQKIISLRPYSSVEELLSKKAVGKSVFEKIKGKVIVQ